MLNYIADYLQHNKKSNDKKLDRRDTIKRDNFLKSQKVMEVTKAHFEKFNIFTRIKSKY